jgi:hypothetical protein
MAVNGLKTVLGALREWFAWPKTDLRALCEWFEWPKTVLRAHREWFAWPKTVLRALREWFAWPKAGFSSRREGANRQNRFSHDRPVLLVTPLSGRGLAFFAGLERFRYRL